MFEALEDELHFWIDYAEEATDRIIELEERIEELEASQSYATWTEEQLIQALLELKWAYRTLLEQAVT